MAQLNRSDCPVLRDQFSRPVAAFKRCFVQCQGARKDLRSNAVRGWSNMYISITLNYHQRMKGIDLQV